MSKNNQDYPYCLLCFEQSSACNDAHVRFFETKEQAQDAMNTAAKNHLQICGEPISIDDDNHVNSIEKDDNHITICDDGETFKWAIYPCIPNKEKP